ncbi:MAG: hypothetical protein HKP31_02430 [Nitrosopumilus sp.]|nr:hypothetical protein [Nitrosopumilus sp.]
MKEWWNSFRYGFVMVESKRVMQLTSDTSHCMETETTTRWNASMESLEIERR